MLQNLCVLARTFIMGCCKSSHSVKDSVELAQGCKESDDKYIGSLEINGHVIDIDFGKNEGKWDLDDCVTDVGVGFMDVHTLTFRKCKFNFCANKLRKFVNLVELNVLECLWEFSSMMEDIASIKTLERLNFTGSSITDGDIRTLVSAGSRNNELALEELNVSLNEIITGLYMSEIRGLKKLVMRGCVNVSYREIEKLVNLEELDVSCLGSHTSVHVGFYRNLVNLQHLNLSNNGLLLGFDGLMNHGNTRVLNLVSLNLDNCVLKQSEFNLLYESNTDTKCSFQNHRVI